MQTRFRTILKLPGNYRLSAFSVFVLSACGPGPNKQERLARTHPAFGTGDYGAAMIVARIVLKKDAEELPTAL